MIHIHYYDGPEPLVSPVVFLAGPTTDGRQGEWRSDYQGQILSAWRASLARELDAVGWSGTLVVPEFSRKGDGEGWFEAARTARGWASGDDVLAWEERWMRAADVVVAWADVRREGPAVGLNARPELFGLIRCYHAEQAVLRAGLDPGRIGLPWAPRRLIFGLPALAQKVSRFRQAAHEAGLPVRVSLRQIAEELAGL